jgi:hypothetical protein
MVMSPSPLCRILSMPCDGHRLKGGGCAGSARFIACTRAKRSTSARARREAHRDFYVGGVFFYLQRLGGSLKRRRRRKERQTVCSERASARRHAQHSVEGDRGGATGGRGGL